MTTAHSHAPSRAATRCFAAIGGLLLMVLSVPAVAQGKGPVTLDQFVDRKSSTVHISGRSIVGVTVDELRSPTVTPELYVPADQMRNAKDICIESTTIDGTYWSRGQVKAEDVVAHRGILQFRYGSDTVRDGESNYRAAVDRFHSEGLAVLATMRACDGTGPGNAFAVVNRTGQPVADRIAVYVNTARSDAEIKYKSTTVRCAPVKGDFQRVAYDAICTIPGPFEQTMAMTLVLSRFGEEQPALPFSLLLALPTSRP